MSLRVGEDGMGIVCAQRNHLTSVLSVRTVCGVCRHNINTVKQSMGEWKAQISLRVRQALRTEMEEFAAREKRKLGNIGEAILEWGFDQLKAAGSIDRLLKYRIRPPRGQGKDG
jgi:hypothetical protein